MKSLKIKNCILAVLTFILIAPSAFAQDQRITVELKNATLSDFFKSVESQTTYKVSYRNNLIDNEADVTLSLKDVTVADAFRSALKGKGLAFEIVSSKSIVITPGTSGKASAKGGIITGTVVDQQGVPISGVGVLALGTTAGSVTDDNGVYSIEVPTTATLRFVSIGYKKVDVALDGRAVANVTMEEDSELLNELVVIGYGTVKKSDLTGSVSKVKSEKLTEFTVSNPIEALQGRATGVQITSNNGSPEGDITVRVRGVNSILGNNDPLYIVDGLPTSPSAISAHDIASMEILKDASATAIYGSRGSNGVILITTKSGKTGRARVDYNFETSMQSMRHSPALCNASEYMQLQNEFFINEGEEAPYTEEQIANAGQGYNWQADIYRTAPMFNHNLNVSGGTEKTHYNLSANILNRDGIVIGSDYNKYNLRSNVTQDIGKIFQVGVNMSYSKSYANQKGNAETGLYGSTGIHSGARLAPPVLTPYEEDGSYTIYANHFSNASPLNLNPVMILNEHTEKTVSSIANVMAFVNIKPFEGFNIKSSFGWEESNVRYDSYYSNKYQGSIIYNAIASSSNSCTLINENIVTWDKTFGKNKINLMGGYTYQENVGEAVGGYGSGYLSDVLETADLGAATGSKGPSSSYSKWVMHSFLARANYSYDDRYMVTASVRADGSSRYSAGNKWGVFPSAAVAWHVSNEEFMKGQTTVSDLKLRASYGWVGSSAIDPYQTINKLITMQVPVQGKQEYIGYIPQYEYPQDLKWETTKQFNVGLDFAMFNGRLRGTVDYYDKLTVDLLNKVYLPLSSGYESGLKNIGSMSNRGWEFMLEGTIISTKDFTWNASGNISINRNRVESLADGDDIFGQSYDITGLSGTVNLIREGEPMGVFYVYKSDGYDENGYIKYKDIDGSGTITVDDRMILGDPNPDFIYAFDTDLHYKGFSLSLFFQGSQGNDLFRISEVDNYCYSGALNTEKTMFDSHWKSTNTPEQNAAAKYPKISKTATSSNLPSDRFIEDGSYLRLKNLQFSYSFPVQQWKSYRWLTGITLYLSAQNLLTFTKYSGVDPEVNSYGSDINYGIDWYSYPSCKTYTAGLKLSF